MLSGFIVFAQFILFLLIGVMLYAYYQQTPLPQTLGRTDEVLPLFVVSVLRSGVAGFIVAAIVAAALSPSLNAMAATTLTDFYVPYVNPGADEATRMRVSKRATVAWGIVQLGVALGAQFMTRSVLDAGLSVLSLGSGPVLGAFLLGTLSTSARERDVFVHRLEPHQPGSTGGRAESRHQRQAVRDSHLTASSPWPPEQRSPGIDDSCQPPITEILHV